MDLSKILSPDDIDLLKRADCKRTIIVLNKIDLPRKLMLPIELRDIASLEVSALTGQGIENLKDRIAHTVLNTSAMSSASEVVINERHADALRRSIKELKAVLTEWKSISSAEVVAQQIRIGLAAIGEIVGKTTTEDLLEQIFSKFCIGK